MDRAPVPQERMPFEEALHHYGEHFRTASITYEEHQPHLKLMALFCQVRIASVMRWLRDFKYPTGDTRIRLLCFLELTGYNVTEYQDVSKHAQQLARLVCFEVIPTFDAAQQALVYSQTQSLYRVILRGESLNADRVRRLNNLLRSESPKLPDAQQHWRDTDKVKTLLEALGLEPRFLTLSEDELPAPDVPLARSSRPIEHQPDGLPAAPRPAPQPSAPAPTVVHRSSATLRPPETVEVPSEFLLDLLAAHLGQLNHLVDLIHECDSPEALARALRKQFGPDLRSAITHVESLIVKLQMLE